MMRLACDLCKANYQLLLHQSCLYSPRLRLALLVLRSSRSSEGSFSGEVCRPKGSYAPTMCTMAKALERSVPG
jgi:hypothetical protein